MTVRPVTSGHHRETGVNSECTSTLPEQASLPDGGYYAMAIHISCCVHAVSWQDSCDSGLPRRAEGRYGLPTSLKERRLVPGHLVAVRIPHSMWRRWYMAQVCVLDTAPCYTGANCTGMCLDPAGRIDGTVQVLLAQQPAARVR